MEPTINEVRTAIKELKNNKAPGEDGVVGELLKAGGEYLNDKVYQLILRIWREEKVPRKWKKGIIIPILKKGDKMVCGNYRGITLLSCVYKIFAKILYRRLTPYTNEILGEYQCGFRGGRSTTDHLFTIRQILEKSWEFNINHWHMFVDFKQAYDSVHRPSMWKILREFGIPIKIVNLVKATYDGTEA